MMEVGGPFFYFGAVSRRRVADHVHAAVEVDESAYDGRRAQSEGVGRFISPSQLLRAREGLQSRDRSSNGKAKVKSTQVPTFIDERVDVLLHPQQIVTSSALHDAEQIVVTPKKDVQAHLDVVPVLVLPRRDLPTDERAQLKDLHIMTRVRQIHRADHTS